jgi:chromosome segregation ATPase
MTRRPPPRDNSLEGRVSRLENSVESLHKDNSSIASTLAGHGQSLLALNESMAGVQQRLEQLVLVTERQSTQRDGLERAFATLGRHEARVAQAELRLTKVEAQGSVVSAAGSTALGIVVRVIATGIVASIATLIAVYASRGGP